MRRSVRRAILGLATVAAAAPAWASFHLMQIEQVIAGVNGDKTAQAIQLRMRFAGQNLVSQGRLVVHDATGSNPIIIHDFTSNVPNGVAGDRVLVCSPNFASHTDPPAVPDFVMTNLIPESYMAAGSLTFQSDGGTIYWRFSWGGSDYTGPNTGELTNDSNGNFGPPWPDPLPTADSRAVKFKNAAGAGSTNNADDYALTSGDAVFTNNARDSFTVQPAPACVPCDTNCDGSVNGQDITGFIAALNGNPSGCSPCNSDANGDGSVNGQDIGAFINCLTP